MSCLYIQINDDAIELARFDCGAPSEPRQEATVAEVARLVEEGIEKTIDWYLENTEWLENVTSGDYQKYYDEQYVKR